MESNVETGNWSADGFPMHHRMKMVGAACPFVQLGPKLRFGLGCLNREQEAVEGYAVELPEGTPPDVQIKIMTGILRAIYGDRADISDAGPMRLGAPMTVSLPEDVSVPDWMKPMPRTAHGLKATLVADPIQETTEHGLLALPPKFTMLVDGESEPRVLRRANIDLMAAVLRAGSRFVLDVAGDWITSMVPDVPPLAAGERPPVPCSFPPMPDPEATGT